MLSLLPVHVGRLCSHFRPRSRALLARMTFRTRWCATTALTARTAVTRVSVTSYLVTLSQTLTVARGRYTVRLSSWVSITLYIRHPVRPPVYSLVFLGLCLFVCRSTLLSFWGSVSQFERLPVYLLVFWSLCHSVCPSACLLACLSGSLLVCPSACMSTVRLLVQLSVRLHNCLSVCESACRFSCLQSTCLSACLHVRL